QHTGKGQFVDTSMTDGVMVQMAQVLGGYFLTGRHIERGKSLLGGALPAYAVYQTADGKYISLGDEFTPEGFSRTCTALGCEEFIPSQRDPARLPEMKRRFTEIFKGKTRDEWFEYLRARDVAVAPVLDLEEAVGNEQ